ncbi:glycosyltransferase [Photorhabdus hainanensis]|uniref:glycosyltransferase n=1 Tax=Photorhabdus hainanensis TaxID=1004166 RepID=UPI001BD49A3A|nr:glycosyltransferase [Photorhabdus hainanensis]MBS9432260.1 glycosyltransferase [Photorhabdus hainanensis]
MERESSNMYDFIFITHLPAFYKINLYNEIAKNFKIMVIFISSTSKIRNSNFTDANIKFSFKIINNVNFEERNKFKSTIKLIKLLYSFRYKEVVLGGWDLIEFWFITAINKKNKIALSLESSIFDSSTTSFKKVTKKIFLSRINKVYCSGKPHKMLLEALNYSGQCIITKGVGLLNWKEIRSTREDNSFNNKFIYVGRLSPEKNLNFLVSYFSKKPHLRLSIIGDGPSKNELIAISSENISYYGYINNNNVGEYLLSHGAFILPSISEPWGLVVEEALYYGLPVICSNKVGSSIDFVSDLKSGYIFNINDENSLDKVIQKLGNEYSNILSNVRKIDFDKIRQHQIRSYNV